MVDANGCLKVIDFGLWQPYVTKSKGCDNCVCTWIYASPEIIQGEESGWNSDSWSIGIVAYELLFDEWIFNIHKTEIPYGKDFKYMIVYGSLISLFLQDINKNEDIRNFVNRNLKMKELIVDF